MRHAVLLLPLMLACHLALDAAQPATGAAGDQWLTRPVDDQTFKTYLDFFAYDRKLPLETKVARVDEEQGLRRERLSFQTTRASKTSAVGSTSWSSSAASTRAASASSAAAAAPSSDRLRQAWSAGCRRL